jgi:hypothetical protein
VLQHMAYDRIRVPDFMFIVSDKKVLGWKSWVSECERLETAGKNASERLETDGESASADDR